MSSLSTQLNLIQIHISVYYLPVICLTGWIGNAFNVVIFSRPRLRQNVCSWYFICLSMIQILLLFFNGFYRAITFGWNRGFTLENTVTSLCKFRLYGFVFSVALSRHFLCLISLDRSMKTSRSASLRGMSSAKNARWLVGCSILFWTIFSLHVPIGAPDVSIGGCIPTPGSTYALFYPLYTIFIGIGPLLVMIIFTILVQFNIRKKNRAVRPVSIVAVTVNSNAVSNKRSSRTDFQLIRLSLIRIVFFLLLNSIATIYPLYSFLTNSQPKTTDRRTIELFISGIGQILLVTYAALTFVLYSLGSSVFRQEAKECLLMIKQRSIRQFQHFL